MNILSSNKKCFYFILALAILIRIIIRLGLFWILYSENKIINQKMNDLGRAAVCVYHHTVVGYFCSSSALPLNTQSSKIVFVFGDGSHVSWQCACEPVCVCVSVCVLVCLRHKTIFHFNLRPFFVIPPSTVRYSPSW